MRLGAYEIAGEIGRGGVGAVFRARAADGREVALKLLLHVTPEARARFERERRLLASLGEAEGFVPLLDGGESSQGPWLAMPLLTGGTLRERLTRAPFPVAESVALVASLAEAAGRAHERGIVHRDLKPENVLFAAEGRQGSRPPRPLIADLGLAKHARRDLLGGSQSASLSLSGQLRGTVGYMAPEQAADAKAATPASDVFALGAILHECLAGAPAFEAESITQLLERVEICRVTPIRKLRPDAPAWLEETLLRALARDPAARFQDGLALARALRLGPPARRRLVAPLAAGFGVAALVALALLVSRRRDEPPRPASAAPVASSARAAPPAPAASLDEGERLFKKGDYPGAVAAFTRAIELDGASAQAFLRRAAVRTLQADPEGALADLDRAIALDPASAELFCSRGAIERKLGARDRAAADFDRALALDPRYFASFLGRALLRRDAGDLAGAEADTDRAIELDPRSPEALELRASIRTVEGRLDEAETDAEGAVALGYGHAVEFVRLAGARMQRGEREAELRLIERAIAVEPRSYLGWEARALSRARYGELDAAIEDFGRAIELDPRRAHPWSNLGEVRERKGDRAGAIADYERALELEPSGKNAEETRQRLAALGNGR